MLYTSHVAVPQNLQLCSLLTKTILLEILIFSSYKMLRQNQINSCFTNPLDLVSQKLKKKLSKNQNLFPYLQLIKMYLFWAQIIDATIKIM